MAVEVWTEFVCIGASNSSLITSTSILEKDWSIARPWSKLDQLLFFKQVRIRTPYFCKSLWYSCRAWFSDDADINLIELVLFWVRYGRLKFWCQIFFSSIRACVVVFAWMLAWSLMYIAWRVDWYGIYWFLDTFSFSGNFQMKIFMIFIVHAWCSSSPGFATTSLPFSYEFHMCFLV